MRKYLTRSHSAKNLIKSNWSMFAMNKLHMLAELFHFNYSSWSFKGCSLFLKQCEALFRAAFVLTPDSNPLSINSIWSLHTFNAHDFGDDASNMNMHCTHLPLKLWIATSVSLGYWNGILPCSMHTHTNLIRAQNACMAFTVPSIYGHRNIAIGTTLVFGICSMWNR